jgi:glycosyltransferase involved in cell wall biosynthesis
MATYNRNDLLVQALQGLASMHPGGLDWEVILLNNAGNDKASRIFTSCSASLSLKYRVEKAPGKNNALNSALDQASGNSIIFAGHDVIPDHAWAKKLVVEARYQITQNARSTVSVLQGSQ